MPRRVRRNKDQVELYRSFTEGETGIFDTYKDVFMFAAAVGFKYEERLPFEGSAEPIEWPVFRGVTDVPIINAIALHETEDINILLPDDETFNRKLSILEEYASGGLQILKRRVLDAPGDPLDNLIALLMEQVNEEATSERDSLEGLVDQLFPDD